MIVCGWCGQPTNPERCSSCRRDPAVPYVQRAETPIAFDPKTEKRTRLAQAERENPGATDEQLAEVLGISTRTVGRWREMSE